MDLAHLEALVATYPLASETAWYAVDASVWPRCDAETSPERGYYPHPYRHSHGQPIVAGWNYSWLVQVPSRCSSWTAPLRMRRMRPGENANLVAAEQIRSWLRQAPLGRSRGDAPAHLQLRRGLRLRPAEPGLGRRADLPVGALARRPLLLCRSDQPAPHRTAAAAWGQVRLRRRNDLAGADRPVVAPTIPSMGMSSCRPGAGCIPSRSACPARHPHAAPRPPAGARAR